ncbi:MAG: hypothetical protein ACK559_33160, partial [bacterium]
MRTRSRLSIGSSRDPAQVSSLPRDARSDCVRRSPLTAQDERDRPSGSGGPIPRGSVGHSRGVGGHAHDLGLGAVA